MIKFITCILLPLYIHSLVVPLDKQLISVTDLSQYQFKVKIY